MSKVVLCSTERPIGYRSFRGKAVWFSAAFTTKAEAVAKRDYEKKHGRPATIIVHHRSGAKYYEVWSKF